jgi:3-oxoacyl-[acyl-carrier protein] reductase
MHVDNLKDKIVLVTGASRGIGKAISIAIAQSGAEVILVARDEEKLKQVKEEINHFKRKAVVIKADFSKENEVIQLFEQIKKKYQRLDVLINNAGIASFGNTEDFPIEEFDKIMNVNIRSVFIACQKAIKLMKEKNNGYIINISSVVGFKGYNEQCAYGISKHGIMGLTKSLAVELQEQNIRVSAILPGGVYTDMVADARPDLDPSVLIDPKEIAHTILYLLSLWDTNAAVDQIYIRRSKSKPF